MSQKRIIPNRKKTLGKRKRAPIEYFDDEALNPDIWHDRIDLKTKPMDFQAYTIEKCRDDFGGRGLLALDTGLGKTLCTIYGAASYFHNYCSIMRRVIVSLLIQHLPEPFAEQTTLLNIIFQYTSESCKNDEWPHHPWLIVTVNETMVNQIKAQISEHSNTPPETIRAWNRELLQFKIKNPKDKSESKGEDYDMFSGSHGKSNPTSSETETRINEFWHRTHKFRPWVEIMTYDLVRRHGDWIRSKSFKIITLDESHKIKKMTSKIGQVLQPYVKRVSTRAFFLSATSLNRPFHMFSQASALGDFLPEQNAFIMEYCGMKKGFANLSGAIDSKLNQLHRLLSKHCMIRVSMANRHEFHPREEWSKTYPIIPPFHPDHASKLKAFKQSKPYQEAANHPRVQQFWENIRQRNQERDLAFNQSATSGGSGKLTRTTITRVHIHIDPDAETVDRVWLGYYYLRQQHPTLSPDVCKEIALDAFDNVEERQAQREKLNAEMTKSQESGDHARLKKVTHECSINAKKAFIRHMIQTKILEDTDKTPNKIIIFGDSVGLTNELWETAHEMCAPIGIEMIRVDTTIPSLKRERGIQAFKKDSNCRTAFVGQNAGGTGIEFVSANIAIFVDAVWDWSTFKQALGRLSERLSQKRDVLIYILILNRSSDTVRWNVIKRKAKNIAAIQDGIEHSMQMNEWVFVSHPCQVVR